MANKTSPDSGEHHIDDSKSKPQVSHGIVGMCGYPAVRQAGEKVQKLTSNGPMPRSGPNRE